jgi:hypothetical protein
MARTCKGDTRMIRLVLTLLLTAAFFAPAQAADTLYRDARSPSFSLLVPDGWTAERNDQGVLLRRDDAYFMLRVMPGGDSPGAMLVQMRPQFERQYKGFREVAAGRVAFGGLDGAFAVYAGVPPSGIESITRIVAVTNGQMVYMAFEGSPVAGAQRRPEMERIERSFTPGPMR